MRFLPRAVFYFLFIVCPHGIAQTQNEESDLIHLVFAQVTYESPSRPRVWNDVPGPHQQSHQVVHYEAPQWLATFRVTIRKTSFPFKIGFIDGWGSVQSIFSDEYLRRAHLGPIKWADGDKGELYEFKMPAHLTGRVWAFQVKFFLLVEDGNVLRQLWDSTPGIGINDFVWTTAGDLNQDSLGNRAIDRTRLLDLSCLARTLLAGPEPEQLWFRIPTPEAVRLPPSPLSN